jgi:hypothetical protein
VNDDQTNSVFNSEKELSAISSDEKNLDQRHMMTKALSVENNSFESLAMKIHNEEDQKASNRSSQMTSNTHVIVSDQNASFEISSLLISRIFSSLDQLLAKNSTTTHHMKNISTFFEDDYQSVEE